MVALATELEGSKLERKVKIVKPFQQDEGLEQTTESFSSYLDVPNLILLGNPGSGKSYLFDKASQDEKGELFTARKFLVYGTNACAGGVLYIDALDEQRSRTDNHNLIDEIVKKILEIKPAKLRLSCRAADWLGETDLQILEPYLQKSGGFAVVTLQPLTDDEVENILHQQGVSDVAHFIQNAEVKGVKDWLRNPQCWQSLSRV